MYSLNTIIDSQEKNRRKNLKREQERRNNGSVSRDQYEKESFNTLKPWEQLGMSRAAWYRKGQPESQEKKEKLKDQKPWEMLGMSQSSWYRKGKPDPKNYSEKKMRQVVSFI